MARPRLRPRGFDELGLKRALSDRLLPGLVGAMAFLAALALAGSLGAASLARHWQRGAGAALLVQVPEPDAPAAGRDGTRQAAVLAALRAAPGLASVRALSQAELLDLLRPWLGSAAGLPALPLPAVLQARLAEPPPDLAALAGRLEAVAPGTLAERDAPWGARLAVLARSLQACAAAVLLLVAGVAAAVVTVATRAGLAARRGAIEIAHGLGATDGYIAGRFAARATKLAATGAACGTLAALPVLLALAGLAAPFVGAPDDTPGALAAPLAAPFAAPLATLFATLPDAVWAGLPALPVAAALLGWATAQGTVRRWLRRLP